MFTNSYIQEIQILFEDFIQKLHVYVGIDNGFGSDLKEYFNDMCSCFVYDRSKKTLIDGVFDVTRD